MEYSEKLKKWIADNNVKVGDRVKVVKKIQPENCITIWVEEMDSFIGNVYPIIELKKYSIKAGLRDTWEDSWCFPFEALELVKEEEVKDFKYWVSKLPDGYTRLALAVKNPRGRTYSSIKSALYGGFDWCDQDDPDFWSNLYEAFDYDNNQIKPLPPLSKRKDTTMKAAIEWFKELPEPIRSKAIRASKDHPFSERGSSYRSLERSLREDFVWSMTKEGSAFWIAVIDKVAAEDTLRYIDVYNLDNSTKGIKNFYYWIDKTPDIVKEKATRAFEEQNELDSLTVVFDSIADAISSGFSWSRTEEGTDYWNKRQKQYCEEDEEESDEEDLYQEEWEEEWDDDEEYEEDDETDYDLDIFVEEKEDYPITITVKESEDRPFGNLIV